MPQTPVLSRGAKRCLSLLESYAARSGHAFPFRKTLCAQLECSMKTLEGYITELRKAGLISSKKRQHSSAEYLLSRPLKTQVSRPLEIQGSVQGSVQGSERRYKEVVVVSEGELQPKPMGTETQSHRNEEEAGECLSCYGRGILPNVLQWGKPMRCRCEAGQRLGTHRPAIVPRIANG